MRATRLAVRVRSAGLTAADVDLAVERRELVRTWAMRGTLHLVAARDLGWVVREFGPYFRDRQAPRRRQLGLDDAACERGVAQLESVLTSPLTRAEIVERVDLDLPGQAAPYFLAFAALEGVIHRGPERDGEPTYVLADVREGHDDQLAVRYLQGYGPAGPRDLATWSGLPLTTARRAFDDARDLIEPRGDHFALKGTASTAAGGVRLLGHFDAFLLGYRERPVAPEHAREVQTGGGFVMPSVSVGGRVQGVWRQKSTKDHIGIEVTPFTTFGTQLTRELSDEVADLGRFLDRRTRLEPVNTD